MDIRLIAFCRQEIACLVQQNGCACRKTDGILCVDAAILTTTKSETYLLCKVLNPSNYFKDSYALTAFRKFLPTAIVCTNHRQIMDIPAIAQSLREVWEAQSDRFRDLLAVAISSHNQMCDTISEHDRFVNSPTVARSPF